MADLSRSSDGGGGGGSEVDTCSGQRMVVTTAADDDTGVGGIDRRWQGLWQAAAGGNIVEGG
ncbi:unnamed protein product [Cuscuta epithymum]|uniref:Uncharacterized protein n=1 Tax=Cuscuta epithymum TaxID=186058 RepID=A0AAV0G7Q8_9ASTE|nr:unnamed protein product [Cuscuta epithymum]